MNPAIPDFQNPNKKKLNQVDLLMKFQRNYCHYGTLSQGDNMPDCKYSGFFLASHDLLDPKF